MAITVKHTKVSTVPDTADTSLVRPSDWNADHTLTGLGTMAEQNANNVAITGGSISGTTVSGYIPTSEKAQPLGVATLDAGGKVPTSQIPLQGDLNYQGTWNATTNTPTLTSSTGTKGYYYVVDVAGSTNLNGITDWQVGDWAIFNGSVWQKVDNTDAVTSVNGLVGTVVLTTTNIAEGTNEYFTTARARASVSAGTGISYNSTTGVITNSSPSLGGDVVGPASATDNAIARFDSTTGKLIQNSVVTVSDTGAISGAESISNIDFAQFDTTATPTIAMGKQRWNVDTNTLAFGIIDGTREVQIGQQMYAQVVNAEAVTITKGQAVYLFEATGSRASVKLANNTGDATSAKTLGLVVEDITAGSIGFVITQGVLDKLNTSAYTEGATLYLGATAGALTATKPKAPNHLVYIGVVERANAGNGQIYVRTQNGYELDEIHDVQINSPANGQTIVYDASTSLWKNANITGGTGLSVTNGAGTIALANTGVTSAVAGTGISVSSATGAVTVTNSDRGSSQNIFKNIAVSGQSTVVANSNDDTVTLANGTGVSITTNATTDTITVTNTAPDQTVVLTGGTGISTSGTYPNFTITNTSPSLGGTVTSVGGTGTVNGITLSGTVTSSGNLTLGGTLSGVSLSTQVTGTLPIANGGTGQTTANAAYNALSPMTTLGDLTYEAAGGVATRLAGNTTTVKQFLSQTGTGSASAAPVWSALPTVLPVLNRAGSTVSVSVGNGVLPVLNRAGGTVNVAIN